MGIESLFHLFKPTTLNPDELLTEVQVPSPAPGSRGCFIKFRLMESVDFAIVSVAVMITLEGRVCRDTRIVLGGVAPTPWRSKAAEDALIGGAVDAGSARAAADAALADAVPMSKNAYKVPIAKTLIQRALLTPA
jgi:xanthine dehydrogenase YagS FAD-binding subunit